MNISNNSIKEFQQLYKKHFGEEISQSKARELGENLVQLFDVLCSKDDEEELNKANN